MDGDLMGNYSDSMFMHNVRSNENKKHQLKKSVHVFLNSLLQAIFSWPLSTPKVIILQATTFPFFPTDETKGKKRENVVVSAVIC